MPKDLEKQKDGLLNLIAFAVETDGFQPQTEEQERKMLDLVERVRADGTNAQDLRSLVLLVQETISLPFLTATQAAAWLGLAYRTIQDAMYQKRLPSVKMGHDRIIMMQDILKYHENRRYSL